MPDLIIPFGLSLIGAIVISYYYKEADRPNIVMVFGILLAAFILLAIGLPLLSVVC